MSTAATGTGSPAGKEQVCAARDQLQESLAALVSPTVIAGGATGITAALEQVRSDLSDVGAAGKDDYASQVTALQSALQEVQSAAGGLGDGNTTSNVGSISASVGAVQTAAQELFTKLAASCD